MPKTEIDRSLPRDSMAERVKQSLLRRIISGELAPGTRLVELRIARELNTSQGPVREALRQLEGIDLVVTESYKGTRVRQVTARDIREAYLVRGALEELAATEAATFLRGNVGELKKEAEAIRKAARERNVELYAKRNHIFHRMIIEASQNKILLRTWNSLTFEVHTQMIVTMGNVNLQQLQKAHWEVLRSLDEGNGAMAGRLLRAHIQSLADLG